MQIDSNASTDIEREDINSTAVNVLYSLDKFFVAYLCAHPEERRHRKAVCQQEAESENLESVL